MGNVHLWHVIIHFFLYCTIISNIYSVLEVPIYVCIFSVEYSYYKEHNSCFLLSSDVNKIKQCAILNEDENYEAVPIDKHRLSENHQL